MTLPPGPVARRVAAVLDASFGGAPLDLAAVVLSFLVVVSGFVADGARWAALGLAVGLPGLVLPYLGRRLQWSKPVTWVVLVLVVVLDLGVLSSIVAVG